jgi:hypothetical protein
MSILSKLFGRSEGAPPSAEDTETYEGFTILPDPAQEGGRWRVGARIEKEVGGEVQVHRLIRADMLDSREAALSVSIAKAKQMIDEQGDAIFRPDPRESSPPPPR